MSRIISKHHTWTKSDAYIDRWQADLDEWTDKQQRINRETALIYICTLSIGLMLIGYKATNIVRIFVFVPFLVGALHMWRVKRAENYYRAIRALEELGQ